MAEHHGEPGGECYGDNYDCGYMWPCPTYRLAEALVRRDQLLEKLWERVDRATRERVSIDPWAIRSDLQHSDEGCPDCAPAGFCVCEVEPRVDCGVAEHRANAGEFATYGGHLKRQCGRHPAASETRLRQDM